MANVSVGEVTITGNVANSPMVFGNENYVVNIGDVNGSIVNIIKPSDRPKYFARPVPVTIKPRAFPSLLGREIEFEIIRKAARLSMPVSVCGQSGVGKTCFIRHVTHTLEAGNFTSGIIYLNVSGFGYEDLLQAFFDAFFDSDLSCKPTKTEILRSLQNIKALIFLDDLQIGGNEAASVLDAVPNSLFVLSSAERSLWGEGEIIQLRGLSESESIKLFERELSRPLNEHERPTIAKICSALQGHPLQILQAASLARDSGSHVDNLLGEIINEKADNKSMAYVNMAKLSASEKQILALLAAAGGHIVPLEQLNGMVKDGVGSNDVQRLLKLGLIEAHSPRYSVKNTLASSISAAWDITSARDILLDYSIKWLRQRPKPALVEESSELLLHTIKDAAERNKWREVIQLGRALEQFLISYKRWQSWDDILNLILAAAKALNDSATQAWALHQLGSRALYLGYASEAETFLLRASNLRHAIGDKAGWAITQHNLNVLKSVIIPPKKNTPPTKRRTSCGILALGAFALGVLMIAAVLAYFFFNPLTLTFSKAPPPISSQIPISTLTETLTEPPLETEPTVQAALLVETEPTVQAALSVETETPVQVNDRCSLFAEKNIKLVTLDWFSGAPLDFYLKMPGGVPGLEDKTVEDGSPWNYSVKINEYVTKNCTLIQEYKERLYCSIELPPTYANTLQPLALFLNGCKTPVYTTTAEIPENVDKQPPKVTKTPAAAEPPVTTAPPAATEPPVDCGPNPGPTMLGAWCACMGGAYDPITTSCALP